MELKDFVKETLVQIVAGVHASQEEIRQLGGIVNPATLSNNPNSPSYFASVDSSRPVFLVDFDVAVTVAENSGTNAHAKLSVASLISLGAGGNSGNSSASTNRLAFKVPLALPVDQATFHETQSHLESFRQPLPYR